jgi:site-specific DNA-cytosine methylase
MSGNRLGVLELFCGIGGCAAALAGRARVVAAVDQNRRALAVYSANFPHPTFPLALESVPDRRWHDWHADVWWMSPPCAPHTRRGGRRDLEDPRARGFLAVIDRLAAHRPRYLALENVPGFAGSRAHGRLREVLAHCGYAVRETLLCPTEIGLPNRRQRFYLVAGLAALEDWPPRAGAPRTLASVLDPAPAPDLWCEPSLSHRYAGALHVVRSGDPAACTACFTSAYGRSPVRSGSYLETPSGLRRFSAAEILHLLDFPESYRLPTDLPQETAWRLAGNSVCVRAVRWVLAAVPGLAPAAVALAASTPCV